MAGKTKINIIYNMSYQLLIMLLPFVTAPYVARVLGKYGVGMHTFTYSIAHYFVLFSMMGLANYGNRSIAQVRDDKDKLNRVFSEIYSMQLVFSLLSVIVYVLSLFFVGSKYKILLSIQSIYVLSAVFDVSWYFYGLEQFKTIVLRNAAIKFGTVVCVFVFVRTSDDIWVYSLIYALSFILSSTYLYFILRKTCQFKFTWGFKKHIKPNLVLFIPVIAVSLYRIMDKIMIGLLGGMADTGLYENADKLVTLPLTVITSIGTVMMPKMSNLYANKKTEKILFFIRDSMQFILALAIGMTFGMAAISYRFVTLYYGEDFAGAAKLVLWLTPVLVFDSFANVIRTQYLIPKGKDKPYVISVVSGAVINLIINMCLIPSLGAIGAVVGTLAAEFSVMAIQCVAVKKQLQIGLYCKDAWEALLAGVIMLFCVKYVENMIQYSILGVAIQILIGIITYGIVLFLLYWVFDRNRLRHLLSMIKK